MDTKQKEVMDIMAMASEKRDTELLLRIDYHGSDSFSEGHMAEIIPRNRGERGHEIDTFFPARFMAPATTWGIDEGFAAALTGMVRALRPKVVFETGTNKGRSTRAIAEGLFCNETGHLTTVDVFDNQIFVSGAIPEHLQGYVTCVHGGLPEVLEEIPLNGMQGIDFAFLDAGHMWGDVASELAFVDAHRAEECLVFVDNARDDGWPEVRERFREYSDYPHISLPTMSGTEMVMMRDA